MLILHSIAFNVDPDSTSNSALTIRRSRDIAVSIPEFNSALQTTPEDGPVAYAIEDTSHGQTVRIHVNFTTSNALNTYRVRAAGGGVLGGLAEFGVSFAPVGSHLPERSVTLGLPNAAFEHVGRYEVEWQWEYTADGMTDWSPLVTTRHIVYLTFAKPLPPWTQTLAGKRQPWASLLDHACSIAQGLSPQQKWRAVRSLTRALNQDYGQRYDITGTGSAFYGYKNSANFGEKRFFLEQYIDKVLNQNPDPAQLICDPSGTDFPRDLTAGCYDMAAPLTLMATLLGIDVRYQYHQPFGFLKVCIPVGRESCNDPAYFVGCTDHGRIRPGDSARHSYDNHTYVKFDGQIFDACMRYQPGTIAVYLYRFASAVMELVQQAIAIFVRRDFDWHLRSRDRAEGFITGLDQADYQARLIDTATQNPDVPPTGSPTEHIVDFMTEEWAPPE